MIDYALNAGLEGSDRVLVSVHHRANQVIEYLEGCPGVQVLQDKSAKGCAGSMLEHYDVFSEIDPDGDLLFLPSDQILEGLSAKEFQGAHREMNADITFMTIPPKDYGEYMSTSDGFAQSVIKEVSPGCLSTTGIFMFRNRYLLDILSRKRSTGLDNGSLNAYYDLACPAVGRDRVGIFSLPADGYWEDIGTPRRYHSNNMRLSRGKNVISSNANIGPDVYLERCIVLGATSLEADTIISDAIISSNGSKVFTTTVNH